MSGTAPNQTDASSPSSPGQRDFSEYRAVAREELDARIQRVREEWGSRLLILGHHYQQDPVIAHADLRGDSYKLAALAAEHDECEVIVFCGVHFMAETADIVANRPERLEKRGGRRVPVILPDLRAGCSLADMADIDSVEECWRQIGEVIDTDDVMPITYVNSAADLKAFCGRHGGIVCTSSNARAALEWAFAQRSRVLFFPDQHLGRNTALAMGVPLQAMPIWNPREPELGGNAPADIEQSRVLLWRGHCSVHQMFLPEHIELFRRRWPDIKVIVHPECPSQVVQMADQSGSTGQILEAIESSPPGTRWGVGTELNLVNRIDRENPDKEVHFLSPMVSVCSTMCRITLPRLCWVLENLAEGQTVNVVEVSEPTAGDALLALERMLKVR